MALLAPALSTAPPPTAGLELAAAGCGACGAVDACAADEVDGAEATGGAAGAAEEACGVPVVPTPAPVALALGGVDPAGTGIASPPELAEVTSLLKGLPLRRHRQTMLPSFLHLPRRSSQRQR